jgi:hypothetical protein
MQLSDLWAVADDSLRALVDSRYRRRGRPSAHADPVSYVPESEVAIASGAVIRSIGIAAPMDRVWPWIAQVFRGGGTYGWPVLERGRDSRAVESADYILPHLPEPTVGECVLDSLRITRLKPRRELVWHTPSLWLLGHRLSDVSSTFRLGETAGSGTRLTIDLSWTAPDLTAQIAEHLGGVLDFILPVHQLPRLKQLIESFPRRLAAGLINRDRAPHQVFTHCAAGLPAYHA